MSTRDEAGARRHYVVRIAAQRFALAADLVEEILPQSEFRALAAMPAHIPGVIRHRDHWIPAVDPRPLLGLEGVRGAASAVLRRGRQAYALLIDAADGVQVVHDDEIVTDHDAVRGAREYFEDRTGTITVLDADSLFRTPAPRRVHTDANERNAASAERVVLTCAVGPYVLAFPVECVLETRIGLENVKPAARPAPGLLGFIDHESVAVPVLSLAHRLQAGHVNATRVLVIATPHAKLAVAVQRVIGFVSVPVDQESDRHGLLQLMLVPGIRGVLSSAAGPLVEIDAAHLLDDAEWETFRTAASAASKSA